MSADEEIGGLTEVRNVDDEVKGLAQQVKGELQKKVGKDFSEFVPLVYRTQMVSGVNYFVKIRVGGDKHVHAKIYKTLEGKVSLISEQTNKSLDDEITYFD